MKRKSNFINLSLVLLFAQSLGFAQIDENVFRDEAIKNADKAEQADKAGAVMDLHLNFNADWRFKLGEIPGFQAPEFDDSGWRTLDVPHDWSIEGQFAEENPCGAPGGYLPTGHGCYRKSFVLPEGSDGKRIKIRFDGVYMNSSVYLNGRFLGNRPYGFSTFEYDLTPHLKDKGAKNVIAVKVDNSLQPSSRWYTGSGINRNVHLNLTEQQHFKSFATFFRTTEIEGNMARLKVDCEVISNNYPESMPISFERFPEDWKKVIKTARIKALLKDQQGGIVAQAEDTRELGDYTSIKSSLDLEVENPLLWSDKKPYLYTLELQLWIDDRLVNTEQLNAGIRTIGFNKDKGMLVNGEKVIDWAPWANANGFLDTMDIAGYNYPDRYFKELYRGEHARYPNRILLGAENYEDLENWLAVRDNPYVVGLFLWVGIDYIGESLAWPRRNWEWGLVDIASFEKPICAYWQAFWSEKPMVHIAVDLKEKDPFRWRCYDVASHWNFEPGDVDDVFVVSNTGKVELFQDGKSLGQKQVNPDTYQAIYKVKYAKGELSAKAFNDNNETVATHTLKTAGGPQQLALKTERMSVATDSDRLIFLTLEVQDDKGTRCPFADNEVDVDVTGAGELIGLDSGNPFSHELYKQTKRKAHEGRLLLTIRPKSEGSITVKCHSTDLKPAEARFQDKSLKR